jgi:hypothetical protein
MKTQTPAELIAKISERTHVPVHDVERVYASTWNELQADARITDYLPVIVARKVAERFRGSDDAETALH